MDFPEIQIHELTEEVDKLPKYLDSVRNDANFKYYSEREQNCDSVET